MLNAASALRGRGPWVTNRGWEYPVVLATVGASIALTGPGSASVDNALGLDWSAGWGVAGAALGVGAAFATILMPRLPAHSAQTDAPVEPVGEAG
jgi:putative oxidoreductase